MDGLRVGDEILTLGGIFGRVQQIDEDEVTVEIAPGTSVRMARRAIAAIMGPDESEADEEALDDDLNPKT